MSQTPDDPLCPAYSLYRISYLTNTVTILRYAFPGVGGHVFFIPHYHS